MGRTRIKTIYLVDDSDDEIFIANILMKRQKVRAELISISTLEKLYEEVGNQSRFSPLQSLVVVDLNLTVCKGTDGIIHLRNMEVGPQILIGISTGSEDPADRLLAFEAGADFFAGKPLDRATLMTIVQSVPKLTASEDEAGGLELFREA